MFCRQWSCWNSASRRSASGCKLTGWNSMPTKPNWCGPAPSTPSPVFCMTETWLWWLEPTLWHCQRGALLGILFTLDLALEKHATSVSTKCFYQLRQLRRVRRSLDRDSATTLVHAFVISRIDYGNSLFANAPTNCSGSWTPQRESSAAHENSTVVWRDFYTTIYTGWISHSASLSSCVCWCSSVYTAFHRGILPSYVYRSPTSWVPQSALRHSRSTKFPSVQHDKLWPTSIFVRRPSCLARTLLHRYIIH